MSMSFIPTGCYSNQFQLGMKEKEKILAGYILDRLALVYSLVSQLCICDDITTELIQSISGLLRLEIQRGLKKGGNWSILWAFNWWAIEQQKGVSASIIIIASVAFQPISK